MQNLSKKACYNPQKVMKRLKSENELESFTQEKSSYLKIKVHPNRIRHYQNME